MRTDHDHHELDPDDDGVDPQVRAAIQSLANDLPEPAETSHRDLMARLEVEMTTEMSNQTVPPDDDSGRRRRRRRWWVPVVAVAATVAVAVGVTVAVNDRDTGPEVTAEPGSVQEFLHQAADELEAEGGEVVVPTEDQWLYRQPGPSSISGSDIERVVDQWIPATTVDRDDLPLCYCPFIFPTPIEVQQIYRDLPDDTAGVLDRIYELSGRWDDVDHDPWLSEVPPEILAQEWVSHMNAVRTIAELLYGGGPPPVVQAKLYRAMAEIPGVVDEGLVDDSLEDRFTGGEAEQLRAIGWDIDLDSMDWPDGAEYGVDWAHAGVPQIVLDPDTHRFRGQRWHGVNLVDDYQPAAIELIFDTAIVEEENQLP